jgi:hypothetical protein
VKGALDALLGDAPAEGEVSAEVLHAVAETLYGLLLPNGYRARRMFDHA